MGRVYQDKRIQRAYDAYLATWRAGTRGWTKDMGHGLWNDDGLRFRGASAHCAFWNGYDGLTMNRNRPMYVQGSVSRAAYMAGRDAAREVASQAGPGLA